MACIYLFTIKLTKRLGSDRTFTLQCDTTVAPCTGTGVTYALKYTTNNNDIKYAFKLRMYQFDLAKMFVYINLSIVNLNSGSYLLISN